MHALAFNHADVPSLEHMPDVMGNDSDHNKISRELDIALVKKLKRWVETPSGSKGKPGYRPGIPAHSIPFTRQNLEAIRVRLDPGTLGVTRKTIDNAISIANRIADDFDHPRGYAWAPLSPAAKKLNDHLERREDRGSCVRILRFLSSRGLDPSAMNDNLASEFWHELKLDWRVKDADRAFRRALYAWNAAAKAYPEVWPENVLTLPITRVVWGRRWSAFPASLEQAADSHFAERLPGSELHDLGEGLEPVSVTGQKLSLRMAACALVYEGISIDQLTDLRALLKPDRFNMAMQHLRNRTGAANASIDKYARDLSTIARHCGLLSKAERKAVKKAAKKWRLRYTKFKSTYEDRDQILLDNLDDPGVCDQLLSLAQRTVRRVKASRNPLSVGNAYAILRALVLELWMCAPIRIKNVLELEFEKHFLEIEFEGRPYIVLRLKASETKNKNPEEHFLNEDAAALLELYLTTYRDIILKANKAESSPFIFPGEAGKKKTAQAKRAQMSNWIRKNTNLTFHPHAIRKIVPKIILDVDPSAIEAAISAGGWKSDRMLRQIYGQRVHRATQKTYIELLESRRLTALATMRRRSGGR